MDDYFFAVGSAVEKHLEQGVEELQAEIVKMATNKGYSSITSEKIDQGCNLLLEKIKTNFNHNLSKFQLYAVKNIFCNDTIRISTRSHDQPNDLDRVLQRLKSQYGTLHNDYLQYASECRDMDALLKDMRTSLFNLRVAIQSFDDYEIQPLSETTHILNQYQSQLQHFGQEAQEMLERTSTFSSERKEISDNAVSVNIKADLEQTAMDIDEESIAEDCVFEVGSSDIAQRMAKQMEE